MAAAGTGDVRVFFLGYNRTATSSLCALFEEAGAPTMHWGGPGEADNAALRMSRNVGSGRPILKGLERYTVFADLTYVTRDEHLEATRLYRTMHDEHPDSVFVLNTRDEDAWIISRRRHRGGDFARRSMSALGVTDADLDNAWRLDRRTHEADVLAYFADRPARFLRFDIDRTPVSELVRAVSPEFAIAAASWRRLNASAVQS